MPSQDGPFSIFFKGTLIRFQKCLNFDYLSVCKYQMACLHDFPQQFSYMRFTLQISSQSDNFIMAENPEKANKSRVQLHELEPNSVYSNHLNNSSSKMQYSMPRDPRFKEQKTKSQYKFYDLPSMLSQRSAGFGYGEKMDLGKAGTSAPPPNTYKLTSQFQVRRKNAIAIGLGRELVRAVSVFNTNGAKGPGPGAYDAKEPLSRQRVILASRVKDLSNKWINEVPGPGTYKTLELLDKNCRSNLSKFESCRAGRFGKGEERGDFERDLRKKNIPGPGQYKSIAPEMVERFPKQRGRSFSKSERPSIVNKSCAPGPGSYKYVSEFVQ